MSEESVYVSEKPLDCPICAYGGLDDACVSKEGLIAWRSESRGAFKLRFFPGGHFFLHTARRSLVEAISRDLTDLSI